MNIIKYWRINDNNSEGRDAETSLKQCIRGHQLNIDKKKEQFDIDDYNGSMDDLLIEFEKCLRISKWINS